MKGNWTGIHKLGSGWQAVVSGGSREAPRRTRWFPAGTSLSEMQAWRQQELAARIVESGRNRHASPSLFQDAAARYLNHPDIKRKASYLDRARDVKLWASLFKHRKFSGVTSDQVRKIRDRWATEPRNDHDERPVSPATINLRLRSLSNVYRVLNGLNGYNPVRGVQELATPDPTPRDIPPDAIPRLLAVMPPSVTRARIAVLAYTGQPSGTLAKLKRGDVDTIAATMRLPSRKKGAGHHGDVLPLSREAVDAFHELDKFNGWGPFSRSSLRTSLHRAAKKVLGKVIRPYDLRHTFATQVAARSSDETAVMYLLQHRSPATTRKYYTKGSHFARAKAALDNR